MLRRPYILYLFAAWLVLGNIAYGQGSLRDYELEDVFGNTLRLADLAQGQRPVMWLMLKHEDAFSLRHIQHIHSAIPLWQSHYGLHVMILIQGSSEAIWQDVLKQNWKIPVFIMPDDGLLEGLQLTGWPATVVFAPSSGPVYMETGMDPDAKKIWAGLEANLSTLKESGQDLSDAFAPHASFPELYATLGQSTSTIPPKVGLARVVSYGDQSGHRQATWYYGGGSLDLFDDLSLKLVDGKMTGIDLNRDTKLPIYGNLKIGSSKSVVESWLGKGTLISPNINPDSPYAHPYYTYPDWGAYLEYNSYGDTNLFSLEIRSEKGRELDPQRMLRHLENVKYQLEVLLSLTSRDELETLYGAAPVQESGGNWAIYAYPDHGFGHRVSKISGELGDLILFNGGSDVIAYSGRMPYGIRSSMSRGEIVTKLGSPTYERQDGNVQLLIYEQKQMVISVDSTTGKWTHLMIPRSARF